MCISYREQIITQETYVHRAADELDEAYLVQELLHSSYEAKNSLGLIPPRSLKSPTEIPQSSLPEYPQVMLDDRAQSFSRGVQLALLRRPVHQLVQFRQENPELAAGVHDEHRGEAASADGDRVYDEPS